MVSLPVRIVNGAIMQAKTCVNCGFLTWRIDGDFVELMEHERNSSNEWDRKPICFVRATTFQPDPSMVDPDDSRLTDRGAFFLDLTRNRECEKSRIWEQGYSPKDHAEMQQQDAIREWQKKCEDDDRAWRASQAERDRQWRIEDQKRERYKSWAIALWTLVSAAVGWLLAISMK
jgi:hypothetical protein